MTEALRGYLANALHAPTLRLAERPALEHQNNRLYDAWHANRHLIVKEYLILHKAAGAAEREYRALERLGPLDLAPRLVLHAPDHGLAGFGPVIVYEFMEGEMWDRQPRSKADLAALAEGWRLINTLPAADLWSSYGATPQTLRGIVDGFGPTLNAFRDWSAREHPASGAAAELCLAQWERGMDVVAHLEAAAPLLCFCRSDPRFANVIARPGGRIGFVDWEDCGLRDPACDVADALLHANQEDLVPPDLWQVFLEGYVPTRTEVDPGFEERLRWWRLLFAVRWLARLIGIGLGRVRDGRLASWTINSRAPNWRLRRYLARARAWPHDNFAAELDAAQVLSFFPGID